MAKWSKHWTRDREVVPNCWVVHVKGELKRGTTGPTSWNKLQNDVEETDRQTDSERQREKVRDRDTETEIERQREKITAFCPMPGPVLLFVLF